MTQKLPLAFAADLHIHAYKAHSRLLDGLWNSRVHFAMHALANVCAIAKQNEAMDIILAGDIFHVRGALRPSTLTSTITMLKRLIGRGHRFWIIPGNHDMEGSSAEWATSVDSLSGLLGAVTVFKEPTNTLVGGHRIAFIPYTHDIETFKKLVKAYDGSVDIIVCHQGIDDFKPMAGMPDTGLSAKWLAENFSGEIYAGHYHSPAINGRIAQIGSMTQLDFGDEGSTRGVLIRSDAGVALHEVRHPKFLTIDITANGKVMLPSPSEVKGNFIRIVSKSAKDAATAKALCTDYGAESITIQLVREFSKAKTETIKITTPAQMISDYIDIMPKLAPFKTKILKEYERIMS